MNTHFNLEKPNKNTNNPFVTPENYFETLPNDILSRTKNTNVKHFQYKKFLSYAASILIIVSIPMLFLLLNNKTINNENNTIAFSYSDDLLYFADLNEIDEATIINYIADNNIETNFESNDDDAIIDYLNNTDEYYYEIIELLY